MSALFSELTPSLNVTELKINVRDLDYIQLSEKFQPTKDIIAINSSFAHKTFEGYEEFLTKPKVKRSKKNTSSEDAKPLSNRGRKRAGDGTVFNACIEFTILINVSKNTSIVRYFPRSGTIQMFSSIVPIDTFLQYLSKSDIPEFSSVNLIGESKPLLLNFKFAIMFDDFKFINLSYLSQALVDDGRIRDMAPFPIQFVKNDPNDIHAKVAIVFSNKIRVHIWPMSGKVNIFGTKTELSASLVYNFIRDIFTEKWDEFICNLPTPSKLI